MGDVAEGSVDRSKNEPRNTNSHIKSPLCALTPLNPGFSIMYKQGGVEWGDWQKGVSIEAADELLRNPAALCEKAEMVP